MNDDKLANTIKGIKRALDKLGLQDAAYTEERKMFSTSIEIATTDGINEPAYLYVVVTEDYASAHVTDKSLIISIEVEINHELNSDQIIRALELVNLINRQAIGGHWLVQLDQKKVFLKKDIYLIKGRLNRAELQWTIKELLECAEFYYPLMMERINSNEMLDETPKRHWVNSSYLHGLCRSVECGKNIAEDIEPE